MVFKTEQGVTYLGSVFYKKEHEKIVPSFSPTLNLAQKNDQIISAKQQDKKRSKEPTVSEVAALFLGEDEDFDNPREIFVHCRTEKPEKLDGNHPC